MKSWHYKSLIMRPVIAIVAVAGLAAVALLQGCSTSSVVRDAVGGATYDVKLDQKIDGYRRSYRIHIPKGYDPRLEWPVMVSIHGAFSTAKYHEQRTGFSQVADDEGFVVIYPNGIGIFGWLQHWNAGHCCGKALADGINDIGFIFAALDDAESWVNVDTTRIFVTGFSNGGMLTHLVGAERGDSIAAIAPIAGAIGGSGAPGPIIWQLPDSDRPLPVLLIHGELDDRVPYNGGPRPDKPTGQHYLSVSDATDYWSRQNQCQETPVTEVLHAGRVERSRWGNCQHNAALQLLKVKEWKHTWPGPHDPSNDSEIDLHGFDAAEVIWQFFKQHQLPENQNAFRSFH